MVIPGGKDDTRGYSGRQGRYTWLFRAARTISAFRLRLSPLTLVPSILLMRLCQSSCFNCSRSSPTMGLRSRFGISHVWPFVAHQGFEEPSVVRIWPFTVRRPGPGSQLVPLLSRINVAFRMGRWINFAFH